MKMVFSTFAYERKTERKKNPPMKPSSTINNRSYVMFQSYYLHVHHSKSLIVGWKFKNLFWNFMRVAFEPD